MNHFQLASRASKITGLNYQFLSRQTNEYLNNIINRKEDEQQDDLQDNDVDIFNFKEDYDLNSDMIKEITDAIMSIFRNKPNVNVLVEITFDYKFNVTFTITKENLIELSKIILTYTEGMIITGYKLSTISRELNTGGFFPYLNKSTLNLEKYGIYKEFKKENYENSCLFLALKNSNQFTNNELESIKHLIITEYTPRSKLKVLCNYLKIQIRLKYRKKTEIDYLTYGKKYSKKIELCLLLNHYFLNDDKKIFQTIEKLIKNNEMELINFSNPEIFKTIYYTMVDKKDYLEYDENSYKKIEEFNHGKYDEIKYYYADTETYIDKNNILQSYIIAYATDEKTECFKAINHLEKFFNVLKKDNSKNIIVYFHNLKFDFNQLIKVNFIIKSILSSNGSVKQVKLNYKGKDIILRDSYGVISSKLDNFGKMFNLETKKSYCPFDLYSEENCNKAFLTLDEIKYIKDDKFINQAKPFIKYGHFFHLDYAAQYCINDCIVLKQGMEKFYNTLTELANKGDENDFKKLIRSKISTPGIVKSISLYKNSLKNNFYEFSNNVQAFLQKFIIGGKCMLKNNTRQYKNGQISSLDANSLYPAAMIKIGELGGFLKGKPLILINKTMDFLNKVDGYFIKIRIKKVNIKLDFPILSIIKEGIRNYTNKLENEIIYVDKFTLEDAIKYQNIEFDIIEGYYFNEGRDNSLSKLVQELYNKRLFYKSNKNPLENVYKLLLNSLYGKFIESSKTVDSKTIIKRGEAECLKFVKKNYHTVKEFSNIGDIYIIKQSKAINKHYNMCHFGAEILSMSKRIMNQVFHAANNRSIEIFYTDTDSLKLFTNDIEELSIEYEKLYNKKLVGNDLGQFKDEHTEKDILNCFKFIGLGKKAYISIEKNGNHKYSLKGVPKIYLKNNLVEIYERLYNGEVVKFNDKEINEKLLLTSNFYSRINIDFNRSLKF
jgi:hypothetical protein